MRFKEYIFKDVTKTKKLPLTPTEKKLIGKLNIFKEIYKLDSTQSN